MVPFILVNVLFMYLGFSPAFYTIFVCFAIMINGFNKETNHLRFLMSFSLFIFHTIYRVIVINHDITGYNKTFEMFQLISFFLPWMLIDIAIIAAHGASNLLPYCPALLDILDGVEMTETQLDPTNLVWVQITICFAIIMFYISSSLEMYHLMFPEQTASGSILTEERVKFFQLLSSVVFLVLRLVLFAFNPREFFLVAKTGVRVYCHYQMWSNPRSGRKVVSLKSTEISADKASHFTKENLTYVSQAYLPLYDMFVGERDNETPISDSEKVDKVRNFLTYMCQYKPNPKGEQLV